MKKSDIIRAWKDEEFAASLSDEQRRHLPENPAGSHELDADDLRSVAGGASFFPEPGFCADDVSC